MIDPVDLETGENPRRTRALALTVVALTAAHLVYFLPRVVDDLFISLRYAENLVHGRGFVYNLGERVEGYSSPLWAVLQALGLTLRVEGVLWTKLLGVGALAALQVGVYRFSREVLRVGGPLAFLPSVCLALSSYVIAWSTLGLETPAHLALIVWSFVLTHRVARHGAVEGAPPSAETEPSRGQRAATVAVLVMMAAARPEGLAWALLAVGVALVVGPLGRTELLSRARRLARVVVPGAAFVLLLACARRLYYDDWVPHTYYAKAANVGFTVDNLRVLARGPSLEAVALAAGLLVLLGAAPWAERRALPALSIAGFSAFFAAAVESDWMPSLRHFLPLLVVAPMGLAAAAHAVIGRSRLAAAALVGLALAGAGSTAQIDMRAVRDPLIGGVQILYKTREHLDDALLALRRIEPPHVARMDAFNMGMITQNFRVLEASAAPVASSWYLGRDIGKVGYYTDVQVFETAGLFTPSVPEDAQWRKDRSASPALLVQALSKKPVAIEWYEWAYVAGRNRGLLAPWVIVFGDAETPIDLDLATTGPTPAEILRRYEASLAKFPRAFLLSTLHGECVGGAMARRTRIVRELVRQYEAQGPAPAGAAPRDATLDDGAIAAQGCTLAPTTVKPGEQVTLRCWFDVKRPSRHRWAFFVHFLDTQGRLVFGADHTPSGLVPPWHWGPGTEVRDVVRFTVPEATPAGSYGMRLGLFAGKLRAKADGAASEAGDRLIGPTLEVR